MHKGFEIIIEPNEEGGFYARIPDVPSIFTGGTSEMEALKNAKAANELPRSKLRGIERKQGSYPDAEHRGILSIKIVTPVYLLCDLQNIPPAPPLNLTAANSGKTVTLSWTDNSTDETDFKVLRRDSLTGDYSVVGTTVANATSYTDTVSTEGTYWYRVKATNANGDSLGSNVTEITVTKE